MKASLEQHVRTEVGRILWEQWDPIGVRAMGEPSDAYNSYVDSAISALRRGATDAEIISLLRHHAVVNMGVRGPGEERLRTVVAALRAFTERQAVW